MLYDNIMIPYDGSASSKAALAEAVRFAKDDPGLTLRIVQIIDTDQLAIDKLEAEGRDEQTVASSAMLQKTYEEVTEEASKALHREIDPLLSGLMNKVYIELLQETQPGGPNRDRTPSTTCATSSSWARGVWARCAAFWAASAATCCATPTFRCSSSRKARTSRTSCHPERAAPRGC